MVFFEPRGPSLLSPDCLSPGHLSLAPIACSLRFAPLLDVASDGASPPRPAKSSALTSNSIHTSGGARRRPSPLPRWEECGPSPKDERAGRRGHPSTSNEAPRYIGCLSFGIDRECLSPARGPSTFRRSSRRHCVMPARGVSRALERASHHCPDVLWSSSLQRPFKLRASRGLHLENVSLVDFLS